MWPTTVKESDHRYRLHCHQQCFWAQVCRACHASASSPAKSKIAAMAEVRASPNDPIFIHHHAMIDLIFEEWLKEHSSVSYGGPPNDSKFLTYSRKVCSTFPASCLYTFQSFQASKCYLWVLLWRHILWHRQQTTPHPTTLLILHVLMSGMVSSIYIKGHW